MTPTLHDPPAETTLAALGVQGTRPDAVALTCEQNGAEWFTARLGIPTASAIANVITGSGEATKGQTRKSYMNGLIAERLTRSVEMQHSTPAMERGHLLEPRARDWYEFTTGRDVQQVGFVYGDAEHKDILSANIITSDSIAGSQDSELFEKIITNTVSYGCSPDGICGDRTIQIKCPMRRGMIGTLLRGKLPAEYVSQIQCEMHVCGVDLCDFVLFTPEPHIPSQIWTIAADPKWQAAFPQAIADFCGETTAAYERVKGML